MKQKLDRTAEEIHKSTNVVRDLNTPLSIINRTRQEKINRHIEDLSKL